jgi:hypothetical protein
MYIVEYNWTWEYDDYTPMLRIIGFCELNKNYNMQSAFQTSLNHYCTSNVEIEDSLKNKISNIIEKYPTDTCFLYTGHTRVYDGNKYIFIFQQDENIQTKIYFEPKFLPKDLLFLYQSLYENQQKLENKDLFKYFENTIIADKTFFPPPPMLNEPDMFTPPVIKEN